MAEAYSRYCATCHTMFWYPQVCVACGGEGDGPPVRTFATGATRDDADSKPRYVGDLSPEVLKAYGRYMLKHQTAPDGSARDADNWKLGIDLAAYMDSLLRHVIDLWDAFEREELTLAQTEELCSAILFNAQGFMYETIRKR